MKACAFVILFLLNAFTPFSNADYLRAEVSEGTEPTEVDNDPNLEASRTTIYVQNVSGDGQINGKFILSTDNKLRRYQIKEKFTLREGQGKSLASTKLTEFYIYGRSNNNIWTGNSCDRDTCYQQVYIGTGRSSVTYCFLPDGNHKLVEPGTRCSDLVEIK